VEQLRYCIFGHRKFGLAFFSVSMSALTIPSIALRLPGPLSRRSSVGKIRVKHSNMGNCSRSIWAQMSMPQKRFASPRLHFRATLTNMATLRSRSIMSSGISPVRGVSLRMRDSGAGELTRVIHNYSIVIPREVGDPTSPIRKDKSIVRK